MEDANVLAKSLHTFSTYLNGLGDIFKFIQVAPLLTTACLSTTKWKKSTGRSATS